MKSPTRYGRVGVEGAPRGYLRYYMELKCPFPSQVDVIKPNASFVLISASVIRATVLD